MNQAGLFDWHERFDQLEDGGDPLIKLNALMDWGMFTKSLKTLPAKVRRRGQAKTIRATDKIKPSFTLLLLNSFSCA